MTSEINRFIIKHDYLSTQNNNSISSRSQPVITVHESSKQETITLPKATTIAKFLQGNASSEILDHFSKHCLKDASTRIFDDPLRSFLEIVVNGLDAANPSKPVGKFGMGFLSILSFLNHQETWGCRIQIDTTYKLNEKDDSLFSYRMIIEDGYEPKVYFEEIKTQTRTGTTITLLPKENTFSSQTLKNLERHLQALQFYEQGKIQVDTDQKSYTIGCGSTTQTWVSLLPTSLTVRDEASGISLDVAQTKLFVPSVTTKTQPISDGIVQIPKFVNYQGKNDALTHFLIRINGVIVMDIPLQETVDQDVLFTLPSDTSLTLARNAVELSNSPMTVYNLKNIISQTIEKVLAKKENPQLLLTLYHGFVEWEKQSSNAKEQQLSSFLLSTLSQKVNEKKLLPIPYQHHQSLLPIFSKYYKENELNRLVPLPEILMNYNFQATEEQLHAVAQENADQKLIESQTVLFVEDSLLPKVEGTPTPKVCSLGFLNTLFAPRSLLNASNIDTKHLAFSIAGRFSEEGRLCVPARIDSAQAPDISRYASPRHFLINTAINNTSSKIDRLNPPATFQSMLKNGLFSSCDPKPFEQFWKIYKPFINEYAVLLANIFVNDPILFRSHASFSQDPLVLEKTILHAKDFFLLKPHSDLTEIAKLLSGDYNSQGGRYTKWDEFEQKFLIEISDADVAKIFMECLLYRFGISLANKDKRIFSFDETIWPIEGNITFEKLEKLLLSLASCFAIEYRDHIKSLPEGKKLPYSRMLACEDFHAFNPKTWQQIESFTPYGNYLNQDLAPIFYRNYLTQEFVQNSQGLSAELQQAFDGFISNLHQMYHRFLTIPDSLFPMIYGKKCWVGIFATECQNSSKDIENNEYGNSNKSRASNADFDYFEPFLSCCAKEAQETLCSLGNKPILFKKLLSLLGEEMNEVMDIEKRNQKLQKKSTYTALYIPHLLGQNILALFTILRKNGVPQEYLEEILASANTHDEAYFMSLILLDPEILPLFNTYSPKLRTALQEVIKTYIQKKIPSTELKKWIKTKRESCKSIEEIFNQDPLSFPIYEYLLKIHDNQFVVREAFLSPSLQSKLKKPLSFTTNQLLNAISDPQLEECLKDNSLEKLPGLLSSYTSKTPLRIVNQCVQHASSRSDPEAMLTECLQNSLDALQAFDMKNKSSGVTEQIKTITFNAEILQAKNKLPQLILEVSDGVGMASLKTLLIDFLIPNYSQKQKEEPFAVGEMGNGSFQMYRDAEMVTVTTRLLEDNEKVYTLQIIPIRENGEVIDLKINIVDVSENTDATFRGTQVRVLFRNEGKTPTQIELEAVACRAFIRQILSQTHVYLNDFSHPNLELQISENEKEELVGILQNNLEINYSLIDPLYGTPFGFVQTRNPQQAGLVLTAGYPFKSLTEFLKEEKILHPQLAEKLKGWSLILPWKSYSPVQSRTRIHLEEKKKEEIRKLVIELLFCQLICGEEYGLGRNFFPHLESNADFEQVFPGNKDPKVNNEQLMQNLLNSPDDETLEAFFMNYSPYFSQGENFLSLIDKGYKTLVQDLIKQKDLLIEKSETLTGPDSKRTYSVIKKEYREKCKKIFEQWQEESLKNADPILQGFLKRVIFKWFEGKVESFAQRAPKFKELKDNKVALRTEGEKKERAQAEKTVQEELHVIETHINERQNNQEEKMIHSLAKEVLNNYISNFVKSNPMKKGAPSVGFIYNPHSKEEASYNPLSHHIDVNIHCFPISSILEVALDLANREALVGLPAASLFLVSAGFSGTLNHELEHAKRGLTCTDSNAHCNGYDLQKKYVHFEACASSFARKAHQLDLFGQMALSMDQSLERKKISKENLRELIKKIRKLEVAHPRETAQLIVKS